MNFAALTVAVSLVMILAHITLAAILSALGEVSRVEFLEILAQADCLIGLGLLYCALVFRKPAAQGETQVRPYRTAALRRLGYLYLAIHAAYALRHLVFTGMNPKFALLGPLVVVYLAGAFFNSIWLAAGIVAIGIGSVVGAAMLIVLLYVRLQGADALRRQAIDPNHLRAATASAFVAVILALLWALMTAVGSSHLDKLNVLLRLPLQQAPFDFLAVFARVTIVACVAMYLLARTRTQLSRTDWVFVFAIGMPAFGIAKNLLLRALALPLNLPWAAESQAYLWSMTTTAAADAVTGAVVGFTYALMLSTNRPVAAEPGFE